MSVMQELGIGWRAARQATRQARGERRQRARTRVRDLARSLASHGLVIAGAGLFTAAAMMVSIPVGLVVAGIACLFLDWSVGE